MNGTDRVASGVAVLALSVLCGCASLQRGESETQPTQPTFSPAGSGASSSARQLQIQLLKELSSVTAKYDEEKSRRLAAEKEVERAQAEVKRLKAQQTRSAQAQAAAAERIAELEKQVLGLQSEGVKQAQQIQTLSRRIADLQTKLEQQRLKTDQYATLLTAEQKENLNLKLKIYRLKSQLDQQKQAALNGQAPAP